MKNLIDFRLQRNSRGREKLTLFSTELIKGKILNFAFRFFSKTLKKKELGLALSRLKENLVPNKNYFQQFSEAFQIKILSAGVKLEDISKRGPVIFYANHPLSGADCLAIASEIEKFRPDIKVMMAAYMDSFPGLKSKAFIVDNTGKSQAKEMNKLVLNSANQHIKEGKSLLIFPAGFVARWHKGNRVYAIDPLWKNGIIRLGEQAEETRFVPIFVQGEPSRRFLKLRLMSKNLSNAYVFREFANQIGTNMQIKVGEEILLKDLLKYQLQEKLMYLRAKLFELGAEYFYQAKSPNLKAGSSYSLYSPLLTKEEMAMKNRLDHELGQPLNLQFCDISPA